MRARRVSLGVVAIALAAAACGGGESRAESLAATLRADPALDELTLTEAEAKCAAEATVAELGDDRIDEIGVATPEAGVELTGVSEADLEVVAKSLQACVDDLDRQLADAVAAGILDEPDESLPVTADEADCVADALVDGFGSERLLVLGARTGDGDPFAEGAISSDEANIVADSFLVCIDIRQVFSDQFEAEGVPAETAACLAAGIPEGDLRDLFAAQFVGDAVDPEALLGPTLEVCGVG